MRVKKRVAVIIAVALLVAAVVRYYSPGDPGIDELQAIQSLIDCNRGIMEAKKSNYDKAITIYSEIIRRKPGDSRVYCYRATCYLLSDDEEKAIADCMEAIRLYPQSAEAFAVRGERPSQPFLTAGLC